MLEQEVKLQVPGDRKLDLRSMSWLLSLAASDIETKQLISTYYDTPDLFLMAQGLGLRLRNKGGQWMQTVKTSGEAKDGLHQRQEWEHELEQAEFDLEQLNQTPLKAIIEDQKNWSKLGAIFTTDFIRETIVLTLAENTKIEFAYDFGKVTSKNLTAPIHEIEMELISGSVEQLIQFANKVAKQLSLEPGNCSKAQLGYQLVSR